MPTTSQNISLIARAVANYSRAEILDALNEMCQICYSENMAQTFGLDTTTGRPPLITTVAGQFSYDVVTDFSLDDVREVAAVVVTAESADRIGYGATHSRDYYDYRFENQRYVRIGNVRTVSATGDTNAQVIFGDDPGASTDTYFLLYYKKAAAIEAETDQLPFPEELHYLIRKGVLAMLSTENYGQTGFDDDVIAKIAKKIRSRMNRGDQGRTNRTLVQPEMQDFDFR